MFFRVFFKMTYYFYFMCIDIFACMHVYLQMSDSLAMELQRGVSCHVGAEDRTWVL